MGLLGCPALFKRLKEKVMEGVKHVLMYIEDIIVHPPPPDHETQLQVLEEMQH